VFTALSSMEYACTQYPTTWAAWTLLILFSEMLKLNYFIFNKKSVKENIMDPSGIFYLLK
jgi:hypothetical protein